MFPPSGSGNRSQLAERQPEIYCRANEITQLSTPICGLLVSQCTGQCARYRPARSYHVVWAFYEIGLRFINFSLVLVKWKRLLVLFMSVFSLLLIRCNTYLEIHSSPSYTKTIQIDLELRFEFSKDLIFSSSVALQIPSYFPLKTHSESCWEKLLLRNWESTVWPHR